MSLALKETSLDAIPEEVKKFVTQSEDGGLTLDNEGIMKGLKAERGVSDDLRRQLTAYRESGLSAETARAFAALGKSPDEIAAALTAKNAPAPQPGGIDPTEYARLKKAAEKAEALVKELNDAKAENVRSKCRELARKTVAAMPDKYDRERIALFVEQFVSDKLALDATGNDLAAVDGELFPDYLSKLADKLGMVKTSTPGAARPGNALVSGGGAGAYASAKERGDVAGMVAAAPVMQ